MLESDIKNLEAAMKVLQNLVNFRLYHTLFKFYGPKNNYRHDF